MLFLAQPLLYKHFGVLPNSIVLDLEGGTIHFFCLFVCLLRFKSEGNSSSEKRSAEIIGATRLEIQIQAKE